VPISGLRSCLILPVPAAEAAVRQHRERLDANARLGVPAHITVLFPFMAPPAIDDMVLTRLAGLFAAAGRFRFWLDHTDWFDDAVLWLAPRDPAPFRALTQRVFEAFPDFPPFDGQFEEVIPHLTIGHGHAVSVLRAAEESVGTQLPIECQASAVTLMTQQSAGQQWAEAAVFTLAQV
jgi:2'-5' RNA ligase